MERAFAAAKLDWRYLTLEVSPEKLVDAVRGLRAMGFRGGNLTIPHKVAVIPLLDRLSPAAEIWLSSAATPANQTNRLSAGMSPGSRARRAIRVSRGLRARKETPAIKTSSPSVCREISRRRR